MDENFIWFLLMLPCAVVGAFTYHFLKNRHSCKTFGKLEKDGCQYCTVCGRARRPNTVLCLHKWETIDTRKVTQGSRSIGEIHLLKCEKCGDKKQFVWHVEDCKPR